jgi:dipeptidyl aminopeptidase/acylaminoacyl peptidase
MNARTGFVYIFTIFLPLLTRAQTVSTSSIRFPKTLVQWEEQRKGIAQTLRSVLGAIPPLPENPEVNTLSVVDKGAYTVEKFTFENGAGVTVPGYYLVPNDGKATHPAIYYCHWHGGNYDLGKEEIFTTHHTPEIPAETLVAQGYVVMAIDAYCFGERSGKGPGGPDERGSAEELSASKLELWKGRSLWTMMVRDDLIALKILRAKKEVDTNRIAVTGISMGATRSWWLMALDPGIKTGVAVGCMTRYQDLVAEEKLKYHGIYYYVPGMLQHFDAEAIISLIAPRPVLFMTGDEDPGSPVAGIHHITEFANGIYGLYNKPKAFSSIVYPHTGHVYTPDMWKRMLEWMKNEL